MRISKTNNLFTAEYSDLYKITKEIISNGKIPNIICLSSKELNKQLPEIINLLHEKAIFKIIGKNTKQQSRDIPGFDKIGKKYNIEFVDFINNAHIENDNYILIGEHLLILKYIIYCNVNIVLFKPSTVRNFLYIIKKSIKNKHKMLGFYNIINVISSICLVFRKINLINKLKLAKNIFCLVLNRKLIPVVFYVTITKFLKYFIPRLSTQLFKLKLLLSYYFNFPLINPKYISVGITSRCPLKCIMCEIRKSPSKVKDEITEKYIKNLIDQMPENGINHLTFEGGEPLLRKDIFKLIKYAKNKNIFTNIVTCGYLMTRETAKRLIESGLSGITISLDGATPQVHDFIRGVKGTFKRVMNGIKYLKEFDKDSKLWTNVNTVIMNNNLNELLNIAYLCKSIGIKSINFAPVLLDNTNRYSEEEKNFWIPGERISYLDKQIDKLIEYKKEHGLITTPEYKLQLYKKYFRNRNSIKKNKCLAGYIWIRINQHGICDYCLGKGVGDIRTQSIKEIWKSKESYEARKIFKSCKKPCLQACAPSLRDNL